MNSFPQNTWYQFISDYGLWEYDGCLPDSPKLDLPKPDSPKPVSPKTVSLKPDSPKLGLGVGVFPIRRNLIHQNPIRRN